MRIVTPESESERRALLRELRQERDPEVWNRDAWWHYVPVLVWKGEAKWKASHVGAGTVAGPDSRSRLRIFPSTSTALPASSAALAYAATVKTGWRAVVCGGCGA